MKEDYKVVLISILLGTIGSMVGYNFFKIPYGSLDRFFFDIRIFTLSIVPPILVLALSLILSKKFSVIWGKIRTRLIYVIFMLVLYMFIITLTLYTLPYTDKLSQIHKVPLGFIYVFIVGIASLFFITTFEYSHILTIAAAYVVTTGIKDRYRRLLLALALIILICLASATPLVLAAGTA